MHYYNQCLVLGHSVLLPRKPSTREEVMGMGEGEKLELAEWINRSCGRTGNGRSLAEGGIKMKKSCCFEDDGVMSAASPGVSALSSSVASPSSSPVKIYPIGHFIADSEGYAVDNDFIPDYLLAGVD